MLKSAGQLEVYAFFPCVCAKSLWEENFMSGYIFIEIVSSSGCYSSNNSHSTSKHSIDAREENFPKGHAFSLFTAFHCTIWIMYQGEWAVSIVLLSVVLGGLHMLTLKTFHMLKIISTWHSLAAHIDTRWQLFSADTHTCLAHISRVCAVTLSLTETGNVCAGDFKDDGNKIVVYRLIMWYSSICTF